MKHIRILLLFVMVVSTLAPAIPAQAQTSPPTVTFTGGGFGHAIGMSQYGAYAMAVSGKTSDEIIDTYYTNVARQAHMSLYGTSHPLGSANPSLWVGLAQDVNSIAFSIPSAALGPVDLCQANDGQGAVCPRTDAIPQPGESWEFRRVAGVTNKCEFRRVSSEHIFPPGDCKASVTWGGPGRAEYLNVDGTDYRYGTLRIRQGDVQKESGRFQVSLEVPVEQYLLGLREVPTSWPTAALEAQVITGRTYALEKFDRFYDATQPSAAYNDFISNSRRSYCYCHVLDSTYDQNFRGMDNEKLNASTYPAWVVAVGATASQVVTYGGSLIQAFYSSSTGGNTENSEDVFVTALPYSRSVPDPWSLTSANPKASWEKTVSVATIASVYGFSEISNVTLDHPAPNASMKITGVKSGSLVTETVSIAKKYSKLGLSSPSVSGLFYDPYGGESPYAFTDIADSVHWENINKIAELRITLGCNPPDNTKFCPLAPVTRGQMAAFLTRALGLVDRAPNPFIDDDDSPFQADIEKIAAAGITIGCNPPDNDRFCPDRPVTRAQMAAFLVRAYGFVDRSPDPFTDDDGSIFEADIERLAAAGVTLGCNPPANNQYCPDSSVLRQHMASFLVRAINHNGGG
ncbi:MAG: SpoIID/LytB domain-containing protein [Acidimicrobiia bacterium]|nr:SpoIID/LytB domain-containing protein [Acidimicrobiia bacterium]